jgi:hypothetical protein
VPFGARTGSVRLCPYSFREHRPDRRRVPPGTSVRPVILGLVILGIPVDVAWGVTTINNRQRATDVIAGIGQLAMLPCFVLIAVALVRGLRLGWERAIPASRVWHTIVFAAGSVGCAGNALRVGLTSQGSRSISGAVIWTVLAVLFAARAAHSRSGSSNG